KNEQNKNYQNDKPHPCLLGKMPGLQRRICDFGSFETALLRGGSAIKKLADLPCKNAFDQRLLNELRARVQTTVMNDCVPGVAGHKNNLSPGTTSLNFIRELSAVLSGQHNVRQQQIELLVSVEQPECSG